VTRARQIRRVVIVTLVLNLAVAGAKVAAGMWFHVLSLTADGLHSSLDGLNNVVALVVLAIAHRPPDEGHPYGHRKFETFAALGLGVSLGLMGAGLLREAFTRVTSGVTPEAHPATFVVAAVTLVVNLAVARYEARRGRELKSELLLADSQHTGSDVLVTLTVITALVAVRLHRPAIDLGAAVAIAAFIGWTAFRIIRKSGRVLADAAVLDPKRITELALRTDGVHACHEVRSRGPEGHVFVDLHMQVEPGMTTQASHALAHQLADTLKRELPGVAEVLVHVEPFGAGCDDRGGRP
jgi:cation diffusion facilitator family transporter